MDTELLVQIATHTAQTATAVATLTARVDALAATVALLRTFGQIALVLLAAHLIFSTWRHGI